MNFDSDLPVVSARRHSPSIRPAGPAYRAALLLALALGTVGPAIAEDTTNYDEPGVTQGREYLAQHFAERIDPFTGNLSLQFVDLRIPGNAGFDLRVVRSYNANAAGTTLSPFGRGWDVHFGRVAHRPDQTCSGATPQTMTLELPDGSRQTFHKSNGVASTSASDYLTTSFWKGQCIPAGGMNVYSPDGTRYEMTEIDSGLMHAKRIVDRFGNTFTLTYAVNAQTGRKVVTLVEANDGREVTFTYAAGKLTSVSGGGVTWGYTVTTATDGSGSYQLTRVTPPAGGQWNFAYNGNLGTSAGSYLLRQVTNPYGGSVNYTYDRVSFLSVLGAAPTTVVKTKSAGSDTWTYAYQPSCPGSGNDRTTVTLPDGIGTVTYEHFGYCTVGAGTVWKIGLLDRKTTGNIETETLSWTSQVISSESVVRPGYQKIDSQVLRPLLAGRTVTRDSLAHSTTYSSFDGHGNPQVISETGNKSRSTTLTYFNSTPLWIVGLPNNETIADVGSITRTRGSAGQLLTESRYGVSTTFTYHSDGSLWTRRDANLKTTTFTNYLYGTARTEQRPESVTITRTVDSSGNVASQTDGEYIWHYDYDGIGRLTFVNYPAGLDATITWGSTTRTMTRGALNESTTFDAFGRVSSVTREGIARTFQHDALGRTTFESLPGSAQGTTTTYDIIGRVKTVTLPVGARSHAYAAGAMTVTDERNNATTFEYDRYGDPDGGYLREITAPVATASVTINRNKIGIVSSVVQNGITRTFGRDQRFFHTSTTEPETGTTTFGRDNVGNMSSRSGGGHVVNYAYDGLNRLKAISGDASATLAYDGRGKLISVVNGAATRTYQYDANGNLAEDKLVIDGLTFVVGYGHDGLDGLATITYPLGKGTVTYLPDALGRPTKASPYLTSVAHHASGNLSSVQYFNGVTATYGENSRQLPSSISAASISLGLTYTFSSIRGFSCPASPSYRASYCEFCNV
jgi:YD repeat-containing protein